MFSFSYTPTERYFLTVFVLSCALLAIFTGAIYRQSRLSEERDNAVITSYEVMRQTRLALIYALNLETGQRGYSLSRANDYLTPYNASFNALDEQLLKISKLITDNPRQTMNVEALNIDIQKLKKILRAQTDQLRKNRRTLTLKELNESKVSMEQVRKDVNNIMTTEQDTLDQRIIQSKKQQRNYLITLFTGSLLALGGLFVANMVIYSLLARNRLAKSELYETEERYKTVMNGINDGMYDYNVEDGTIYYSPSYKTMLGYNDSDFKDTLESSYTLIHPDDFENFMKAFEQYKNRETPTFYNEFRMRHKNGSWRWILSRGIGVWEKNGQFVRLIGAHTDITSQKEREEELKQLNTDLEGFTYIASHDLRAPLVNIKGFSGEILYSLKKVGPLLEQLKKTSLSNDDKQTIEEALGKDIPESLNFIESAVQKMDKLTNAILDLSRIGRREYSIEDVNTNDVVKRCLHVLAYEISKKNTKVECDNLPIVSSDGLALEQIFSNILDNAVKYMDPERPGTITIHSKLMPHTVLFSISDNGRGISPTEHKKVFDIFRRAQNTADVRGVGMGMAYVKATLRKLGGKIWFESDIGTGTTFYFTLPYRDEVAA